MHRKTMIVSLIVTLLVTLLVTLIVAVINEKKIGLNLNKGGGGWNPPYAQEIGCHFSRNDPNVLKLPDFFKNDVKPKVKESFWSHLA